MTHNRWFFRIICDFFYSEQTSSLNVLCIAYQCMFKCDKFKPSHDNLVFCIIVNTTNRTQLGDGILIAYVIQLLDKLSVYIVARMV